ncbi:hypothetical protein CVO96_17085 [Deinococcus koreensis]|uniref:CBM6 domain-containing protein n=1 Tax=Deinococcus koreensis TaxID=2054903 RepID=A0A2K3UT36_9DEIO|nr:hypothetical protein CVO96_17085 [Deinococcus koreensis]
MALLWCSPASQAATPPIQFSLSQLEKKPGTILISPGYITLIEFPAPVTNIVSGNILLFKREVIGNRVALSAAKTVGQTDLLVTTGGRIALFVVQIDGQGTAPRRYSVTQSPATPPLARPPAAAPAPAPVRPVAAPPAPRQTPTPAIRPAGFLGRFEAEQAVIYRADLIRSDRASGGRYVEHINEADSQVTFPTVRAPRTGSYTLRIRYANGSQRNATQPLWINGVNVMTVQYPPTGSWDQFATINVPVSLKMGTNTLKFGRDQEVANLDVLELWGLSSGVAATPPPPIPSGAAPAAVQSSTPVSGSTPAPAPSGQRTEVSLVNPGFEEDFSGWTTWWDANLTPGGSQSITTQQPHSGKKFLTLSNTRAFKQNCSLSVSGLANGTYTFEMWVRTSGGQNNLTMFALDYGGPEMNLGIPLVANNTWVKYSMPNIKVTKGQVVLGIWSNSPAGTNWAHIDDVRLYRDGAGQP